MLGRKGLVDKRSSRNKNNKSFYTWFHAENSKIFYKAHSAIWACRSAIFQQLKQKSIFSLAIVCFKPWLKTFLTFFCASTDWHTTPASHIAGRMTSGIGGHINLTVDASQANMASTWSAPLISSRMALKEYECQLHELYPVYGLAGLSVCMTFYQLS